MKPLFLILKKKYFDQIKSGEKTEELRLMTPYWINRLVGKEFSRIVFQNGYAKTAPRIEIEYLGHELKNIKHEFFGNDPVAVFALKLGKIKYGTLHQAADL